MKQQTKSIFKTIAGGVFLFKNAIIKSCNIQNYIYS